MTNDSNKKTTIRAGRRRQGTSPGPRDSGRAEMPTRDRPSSSGGTSRPVSGGTGGTGGGFSGFSTSRGAGCSKLPIGVVILIILAYIVFQILSGGTGDEYTYEDDVLPTQPVQNQPTQPPVPTRTPRPIQPGSPDQTWTVLLYQDADDSVLEQDIMMDLNEVEMVGSSDQVKIIAQMDRFKGGYSGDGNWTSTRRYFITQDDDLSTVRSQLVSEPGELNMAQGSTLADFVMWGVENYPADKYVLILSDHGMGWPGGFSDPDPVSRDSSNAPLVRALKDDQLYLMELDDTLAQITALAGIDKFELIGMDACLMGHIEVLSALEPYAHYAVVSQETEPSLGWAYASFLQDLVDNPGMSGAALSESIVDSYIRDDQRINDPQARSEFMQQGSPMGGLFGSAYQISADALIEQLGRSVTLTAADLSAVPALITDLNTLAYTLQGENQKVIASARSYAPAFTNIFGKDLPSPYIDLGGFITMLKRGGLSANASQAADEVLYGLQDVVIAEKHGSGKSGASGISIYFPNSTLYRSPAAGPQSYSVIAQRFAQQSLWDDFLVFFYNDINFQPQPEAPAVPPSSAITRSPGQGEITIAPLTLSADSVIPGELVEVSTTITGDKIGYIYLFVGYYDANANSIYKADTDYLDSAESQELNGVYYPVWGSDAFDFIFEWEPTLFQISDGTNAMVTLFNPQTYGASAQDAVYTVDGIYTFTDGSSRNARLYFRDGILRQVFTFSDDNWTGGARDVIPQSGDTFTITETWLDLDSSGRVTDTVYEAGQTLTFSDQPFIWEEVWAPVGDYVLGIIVTDLDGNAKEAYTTIAVK